MNSRFSTLNMQDHPPAPKAANVLGRVIEYSCQCGKTYRDKMELKPGRKPIETIFVKACPDCAGKSR